MVFDRNGSTVDSCFFGGFSFEGGRDVFGRGVVAGA
jgi:hypothetical protein